MGIYIYKTHTTHTTHTTPIHTTPVYKIHTYANHPIQTNDTCTIYITLINKSHNGARAPLYGLQFFPSFYVHVLRVCVCVCVTVLRKPIEKSFLEFGPKETVKSRQTFLNRSHLNHYKKTPIIRSFSLNAQQQNHLSWTSREPTEPCACIDRTSSARGC